MKMRLSEEDRKLLTAYVLADPSNALALHRENPALVEEAMLDQDLMTRLSNDPALFATLILGLKPTPYQLRFLSSNSKRIIIRWPRQSGKTLSLAVYAIWFAVSHASTTTLIVAPSRRQSMILNDVIQGLIDGAPKKVRAAFLKRKLRTITYLRNGSRIVALPNSENLLRGYTASLIILDEAAFFQNDEAIFQHVLTPMLATTGGKMIVSSTPWGKNTQFYRISNDPAWETHHATWEDAVDAGLYRPEFLEEVERTRETLPLTYRMEYEAEFAEEADTWLTQDLLAKACSHELEFESFDARNTGDFYVGVDLAERVDYTAIAVVRREGKSLSLNLMHRFPLGTSLAACIGYLKVLCERWSSVRATYVDSTKHGDYIIKDMQEAGVRNARGVFLTQEVKQEAAQMLRQRLAEGVLRIPFDQSLLNELNLEQYELTKTGRVTLIHASGTHDDRFWALALAVYAVEKESHPSKPIARIV